MKVVLTLDNTPLSHFARAGRLELLAGLVSPYRCLVPSAVISEITKGIAKYPALSDVPNLGWLEVIDLSELPELVAFARFKSELGGGIDRNNGEAAVLALAQVHGGIAVIDEREASRIAQRDGIEVHGTLWLLINAFRNRQLSREEVEGMVDQLASTDMALPVDGAGLFAWAYVEGLLP